MFRGFSSRNQKLMAYSFVGELYIEGFDTLVAEAQDGFKKKDSNVSSDEKMAEV